MGFLFGLQVAAGSIGATGSAAAVLWFHLLFVFPYVFLSLSEPWRALDPRYARTARCLGAGPWRVLLRVKAPLLRAPLALSVAVGLSVSLSLYLPTVLAGAGRITTLATETVALYGGGDRRVLGVYAMLQTALTAMLFVAALRIGRKRRFRDQSFRGHSFRGQP
jgi:putative thiamine transport system permease protein